MEVEQSESFRDLMRVKVFDAEGKHIGHIQDMAMDKDLASQVIGYLGVHLEWTDRVGEVELVRRVEDIVLLLPWSSIASIDEDAVRLSVSRPDLDPESAGGKWLVRRDILDKQMLDAGGSRIQRVDDVLLSVDGRVLTIKGLEVSRGFLMASSKLRNYISNLRKEHASKTDYDVIPWEAVERIEDDVIVIGERVEG